jgi:hypothetical protein
MVIQALDLEAAVVELKEMARLLAGLDLRALY